MAETFEKELGTSLLQRGETRHDRCLRDAAFVELNGVHHEALELPFDGGGERLDSARFDHRGGARDDV